MTVMTDQMHNLCILQWVNDGMAHLVVSSRLSTMDASSSIMSFWPATVLLHCTACGGPAAPHPRLLGQRTFLEVHALFQAHVRPKQRCAYSKYVPHQLSRALTRLFIKATSTASV